jgi:CheY-like chemotaxis protein
MVPELAATKEISLAFGMPYARYFLSDAWEIPRQPGRVRTDRVATMHGTTGIEGHRMSGEPPAKTRVLVVDDNPDIAWTCSTLFRLSGFDVETALDGRAALVTARAFRPEVALLDIGLPGMDGFELARRLRAEYGPALLLIAITGYGMDEYRMRSEAAGFNYHCTKPVDFATLSSLIQSPITGDSGTARP